jgi:multisubunit Na+/H+ antiporter MnhF subunit
MSGHYSLLIISLGVISCAFCVYVAKRAKLIDNEGLPLYFFPRIFNYLIWLFKEIFISNINTAKVIISGKIEPETFTVKASQSTDVARVTYANSITLTPGTVTTKIKDNMFEVHALNSDFGDDVRSNVMDKKSAVVRRRSIMFLAALIACAISGILVLIRIVLGKTTFDRVLGVNSLGTIIVIGIALHGFYSNRPEFLDIAIVYALINFIGTVAVLKLFSTGSLGEFKK